MDVEKPKGYSRSCLLGIWCVKGQKVTVRAYVSGSFGCQTEELMGFSRADGFGSLSSKFLTPFLSEFFFCSYCIYIKKANSVGFCCVYFLGGASFVFFGIIC